jgi:thiamine phosphate synthase YjbQ (UPF0047 family)
MKSQTEYLSFNVPSRMGFVNITPEVARVVADSGVQEGLCLVKDKRQALVTSRRRSRFRTT